MIEPTVGRVVWFRVKGADPETQPRAALVAYVHNSRMVNLCVISHNGEVHAETSIALWDGEGMPPALPYAEWMPYQKGQAARTAALEAKGGYLPLGSAT